MNPTSQRDARIAAGTNASASVTPDLKTNSSGMVKTGDGTYVNRDFISQSGLNAARQASGVTAPTIPATAIGSTSPVSLPPKPVSTAAEGLSGMASSVSSAATAPQAPAPKPFSQAGLEQSASDLGAEVAQQREGIKGTISKIADIQSGRQSEEEAAGLSGKVERVNDVTNRLEASQRAQTNELRALDRSGLTDAQKDQRTREINRQYAFEQADLALQQSAANRDYLTAKTILDRKMELQLEPLKTALEYDKFFYEENRDLFTKAEDRAFQNMVKESDRAYNREKEKLDRIAQLQLQAVKDGKYDLAAKLGQATTVEGAIEEYKAASGGKLPTPPLVDPVTGKADPSKQLSSIISLSGAKDNAKLQDINGVVAAAQQLANQAQSGSGDFRGVGPLAQFTPGFLTSQEGTNTRTAMSAINLKVQQWASGASLTKQQTEFVEKMVPEEGDSDTTIQRKTNALVNFMLFQAKGLLASQGITYDPGEVDLFKDASTMSNDELLTLVPGSDSNSTFFDGLTGNALSTSSMMN